MTDRLIRAVTKDKTIRLAALLGTAMVETARKKHNTAPTATAALGRALMGTMFLGMNLKNEETLTMRILGNGPLGAIITQADANRTLRGYVQNPDCHLPATPEGKLDVGKAVGQDGIIYVTKDLSLKEPYTSSSPLVSGEIAEDIAYYLHQSEQTPVVLSLGVLVDVDHTCIAAGGFFIQALPGTDENILCQLEERLKNLPSVSSLIYDGVTPEGILERIFPNESLEIIDESTWVFSCKCSKERLEKVLISLGTEEIKDMIEKEGQAELRCHFCNEEYVFSREELRGILEAIEN